MNDVDEEELEELDVFGIRIWYLVQVIMSSQAQGRLILSHFAISASTTRFLLPLVLRLRRQCHPRRTFRYPRTDPTRSLAR